MDLFERFKKRKTPDLEAPDNTDTATERYLNRLAALGIPSLEDWRNPRKKPATTADVRRLYNVNPSFVDLLPWVDYLPDEQAMLLEDGVSRAAFFELTPIGTEGRDPEWLRKARDALENALQDSFDELETSPWVIQLYAQDETNWDDYLQRLHDYIQPRARGTTFTEHYLALMKQHLEAISKPGGLFEDTKVSQLPWRGQQRRVRLVVYRRTRGVEADVRGQAPGPYLKIICDRLVGGLENAGIKTHRMNGHAIRHWLIRWFNPRPDHLGPTDADIRRFYELVCKPVPVEPLLMAEAPEPETVSLLITHNSDQPLACVTADPLIPPPPPEELATYKLLTQVQSLESERYSLDQAMLPASTGLSHELSWDGPGTWWEDLALPISAIEESAEHSMMLTLMFGLGGAKSHNWG